MTQVDTILAHGTLITMDAAYTLIADGAVAIKDEAIVALGPTDDLLRDYAADTCAKETMCWQPG